MNLDLSKIKKVFFVGIGGIGISAIARMMLLEGKEVFGSDMSGSVITQELQNLGAKIALGQGAELIPKDMDLIVYTIAIKKYDQVFFNKLQEMSLPMLSYPEMLGVVTKDKYTIAVAGTHGKTTTTAMIAKVLVDAGLDPTVIVGSLLKDYKSNLIVGKSKYFVVEACEYERSFLNLHPNLLVITNIEEDHLDYYKDLDDIKSAFAELEGQSEQIIKDYRKYLEKVPKLLVPGEHNRLDAAAAFAVAKILDIPEEVIKKSLENFKGTWRRLEKLGYTSEGTIIYDDYAHHPTEIKASLQALRELYPKDQKKITVLFQPHLYSRTKALFDDFSKSFKEADRILLLPIYFAREDKDESVSSEKLAEAIAKNGGDVQVFDGFESAGQAVLDLKLGAKDVFVSMGAGEANKVTLKSFKIIEGS
jgi:UDP-N-acetylmuramate--alanine ligase